MQAFKKEREKLCCIIPSKIHTLILIKVKNPHFQLEVASFNLMIKISRAFCRVACEITVRLKRALIFFKSKLKLLFKATDYFFEGYKIESELYKIQLE